MKALITTLCLMLALLPFNIHAAETGKLAGTIVDENRPQGTQSVVRDGRDDSGQSVSTDVYFYVWWITRTASYPLGYAGWS